MQTNALTAPHLPRRLGLLGCFALSLGTASGCGSSTADAPSQSSTNEPSTAPEKNPEQSQKPSQGPEGPDEDPDTTQPSQSPDGDSEGDPGQSPDPEKDEPKFDLGIAPEGEKTNPEDDCDCKPNTDLIYLLDHADAKLWTYNPKDHAFKQIGSVNCPTDSGDTAFSLAVDRFANAWIQMSPSGKLFKVDTLKNNACTDSGYVPASAGPKQSGMAFSDRRDDKVCEQLYLHSSEGGADDWKQGPGIGKLGTVDPETVAGKLVSKIDYNGGEMTGTQDGRLFAFAGANKGTLIEYNPADGSVVKKTELGDLVPTFAFAFAFWGGDFYFFTLATNQLPLYSKVTKLDYDGDGSLTTVVDKVPFMVVGAGVSVCAPLDPPK